MIKVVTLSPLNYADAPLQRPRLRVRRIGFAFTALALGYATSWLAIAGSAQQVEIMNDHTMYKWRVPKHEYWPKPLARLFAPAFAVDAFIRPRYWKWTEDIRPWPVTLLAPSFWSDVGSTVPAPIEAKSGRPAAEPAPLSGKEE